MTLPPGLQAVRDEWNIVPGMPTFGVRQQPKVLALLDLIETLAGEAEKVSVEYGCHSSACARWPHGDPNYWCEPCKRFMPLRAALDKYREFGE